MQTDHRKLTIAVQDEEHVGHWLSWVQESTDHLKERLDGERNARHGSKRPEEQNRDGCQQKCNDDAPPDVEEKDAYQCHPSNPFC